MTTKEFLRILNREIEVLPALEAQRAITYYRELIEDRIEEGMSEREAVASMEDISVIAQQILSQHEEGLNNKREASRSHKHPEELSDGWRKAILICTSPLWGSILLTLIVFVFSIYLFIWCIIISLYAIVVTFGVLGIAGAVACVFDFTSHTSLAIVELGISLFSVGIFILSFHGIRNAQKQLFNVQRTLLEKTNETWKKRRFW